MKKSTETRFPMWLFKKVRQVWEGGLRPQTMYLATLGWVISIPSFRNSPWMRGAPRRELLPLIVRIRVRTSTAMAGRPGFQAGFSNSRKTGTLFDAKLQRFLV